MPVCMLALPTAGVYTRTVLISLAVEFSLVCSRSLPHTSFLQRVTGAVVHSMVFADDTLDVSSYRVLQLTSRK